MGSFRRGLLSVACLLAAAFFAASPASADPKDEMVAFVKKAVEFAKKEPREAVLKAFNDRNGDWVKGELYIYGYDRDGVVVAHGGNNMLVGKNLIKTTDRAGKPVIHELLETAKKGGGFVEYLWPNPAHDNQYERKLGYVEPVDGNLFIGSGIYVGVPKTASLKR